MAGSRDAVIMVEAGASGLSEEQALEAVRVGQEANLQFIALQDQMVKEQGVEKYEWTPPIPPDAELDRRAEELAGSGVAGIIDRGEGKGERNAATTALEKELIDSLGEEYGAPAVAKAFDGVVKKVVRSKILKEGRRPDGRKVEEIRPISCAVGILPRTHGTGLFQRGGGRNGPRRRPGKLVPVDLRAGVSIMADRKQLGGVGVGPSSGMFSMRYAQAIEQAFAASLPRKGSRPATPAVTAASAASRSVRRSIRNMARSATRARIMRKTAIITATNSTTAPSSRATRLRMRVIMTPAMLQTG